MLIEGDGYTAVRSANSQAGTSGRAAMSDSFTCTTSPGDVDSTPSGQPVISLSHVTKWFFKDGSPITAIDDVSADLHEGSFVSFVGPSGCGKSTLFNCIAGVLSIDRGSIHYRENPVAGVNSAIGYMTQKDTLLPWRTVLSNVMLPLTLRNIPKAEARDQALSILERVGLSGFAHLHPRELSGGMLKRAALARILVYHPETLLMDEPFGNVDAHLKIQLHRELLMLWESERKTVVFVTHDLEEAIALSDVVFVLSGRPGRIKTMMQVDLPRPRDAATVRFEPRFMELHRQLWTLCDPSIE